MRVTLLTGVTSIFFQTVSMVTGLRRHERKKEQQGLVYAAQLVIRAALPFSDILALSFLNKTTLKQQRNLQETLLIHLRQKMRPITHTICSPPSIIRRLFNL